jgi:hypothetical protein
MRRCRQSLGALLPKMLLEAQECFFILPSGGGLVWAVPEYVSEHGGSYCRLLGHEESDHSSVVAGSS